MATEIQPAKRKEFLDQLSLDRNIQKADKTFEWADDKRAVSNNMLRSAMFSVSAKRKTYNQQTIIASDGHAIISQIGIGLDQDDEDVVNCLMHYAKKYKTGTDISLTSYELLKTLDRTLNTREYEKLHSCIARLSASSFEIRQSSQGMVFGGPIVSYYARNEDNKYLIAINPAFKVLFSTIGGSYTLIDYKQRKSLKRDKLAKWLHGYYSSHKNPFALRLETLQQWSGSSQDLKHFKQSITKAMKKLVNINAIKSYSIDDRNLVSVKVNPKAPQIDTSDNHESDTICNIKPQPGDNFNKSLSSSSESSFEKMLNHALKQSSPQKSKSLN